MSRAGVNSPNQIAINMPDHLPSKKSSASRRSSLGTIMDRFRGKPKSNGQQIYTTRETYTTVHGNGNVLNQTNSNSTQEKARRVSMDIPCPQLNGYSNPRVVRATQDSATLLSRSLSIEKKDVPAAPAGTPGPVSPEEFLAMLNRNRAYSDSKDLRQAAIKAAASSRLRKISHSESVPVGSESPRHLVTSSPHRKLSTTVIPEDSALIEGLGDRFESNPRQIIPQPDRRRRMSAITVPHGPGRSTTQPVPPVSRARRFSEPVAPRGLSLVKKSQSQMDVEETMLNFPKSQICMGGGEDASTPPVNKTGHVILWKAKGQSDRLYFIPENPNCSEALELDGFDDSLVCKLAKMNRCYDVMPPATSVVVLSTDLKVVSALDALTLHSFRAAPLWNSKILDYDGMLTITDFIRVLLKYCNTSGNIREIKDHSILTWKDILSDSKRPLVTIDADSSLHDAVCLLREERVHRLPVIDPRTNVPLYILTYKKILEFFCQFLRRIDFPITSILRRSLGELKIGTYENVSSVNFSTSLKEALTLLVDQRLSCLPVLDRSNRVVNIFSKAHITNLAVNEKFTELDITVGQAINMDLLCYSFEGVYGCKITDTLYEVICKFSKSKAHRLFVVDDLHRLEGVVSLSDVIHFLVLQQEPAEDTDDHWDGDPDELVVL